MTYKEAFLAVYAMTYDQTRLVRLGTDDQVLRKVAGWRITKHGAYVEILSLIRKQPYVRPHHTGQKYRQSGKPKASIVDVRERARREHEAAC